MLKYEQIAQKIDDYIDKNNFPQGTRIQTVQKLSDKYKVSKSTIVKALECLEIKGSIYQVRGSGIFVRKKNNFGDNYINLNYMMGFTKNFGDDLRVSSKIIDFDVIFANKKEASLLDCKVGEEVYMIKRLRYLDKKIIYLEEAYYKKSIVPVLNRDIAKNSIFKYLMEDLNLSIGFSDTYINAEKLDSKIAKILELSPGDPCMVFLQQVYLINGKVVNFTKLTYHYKHIKFFLQSLSKPKIEDV